MFIVCSALEQEGMKADNCGICLKVFNKNKQINPQSKYLRAVTHLVKQKGQRNVAGNPGSLCPNLAQLDLFFFPGSVDH